MSTPQPYLGLSTDRLTALINAKNDLSLQMGVDFLLGPPQAYSDSSGRNTKVVLTPINDQYESAELHYWRLPLTALNSLPQGYIQPVQIPQVPFTLVGILPQINAALGLNLQPNEIIDQTYSTQQSSYALPINEATCYAWLNSNYQFPAQFQVVTPPDTPYVGVRPCWFVQLNGTESNYYPVTMGTKAWATPLSEIALSLSPNPSQWVSATGNLAIGGAGGVLFDLAVLSSVTGLPEAQQPTSWSVSAGFIQPLGTLQNAGYQSIYTDPQPTLIVSKPSLSLSPTTVTVTGTYADGSTITAQMIIAPTLDLGPPLNLTPIKTDGLGLVSYGEWYVNKDGYPFTIDPSKYPATGYSPRTTTYMLPQSVVGQVVDSIYGGGQYYPTPGLDFIQGTTANLSYNSGYKQVSVQVGDLIVSNDNSQGDDTAAFGIMSGGQLRVIGTPHYGGLLNAPSGMTGLTTLNIDTNPNIGSLSRAASTNGTLYTWGYLWDNATGTNHWQTFQETDTKGVVYAQQSYALDYTGLVWKLNTSGGSWLSVIAVNARLNSMTSLGAGLGSAQILGVSGAGDVWNVNANTKLTTSGVYSWAGGGLIMDKNGRANWVNMQATPPTITPMMSTVKLPPGGNYSYPSGYITYPNPYNQYTGPTIPIPYRKVIGGWNQAYWITNGGYGQTGIAATGIAPALMGPVLEFSTYGLGRLDDTGWAFNLDGTICKLETSIFAQAAPNYSQPEFQNSYKMITATPRGQSSGVVINGVPQPGNYVFPALGMQFDGTVTLIGYNQLGGSVPAIYTAKKAKWMCWGQSTGNIYTYGALLTVDGDILAWGQTNFQGNTAQWSDTAYIATNPNLVKICMTDLAIFGLEADGTIHQYDYPWASTSVSSSFWPQMNAVGSLPAGVKAYSIIGNAQGGLVVISTDMQTCYVAQVVNSAQAGGQAQPTWTQFRLSSPMVDFSTKGSYLFSGATYGGFWYVNAAGDVRSAMFSSTGGGSSLTPTFSDTLVLLNVVNVGLLQGPTTALGTLLTKLDGTSTGFSMIAAANSQDHYWSAFVSTMPVSRRLFWDMGNNGYISYVSASDSFAFAAGQTAASVLATYGSNVVSVDGIYDLADLYATKNNSPDYGQGA